MSESHLQCSAYTDWTGKTLSHATKKSVKAVSLGARNCGGSISLSKF